MNNSLKSDCNNCFGLCCVALPYGKSADFPFNKDGGEPCRNLCSNNLCSIHGKLRETGFRGCVSYECFGAGQHVSQSIYNGKDWREGGEHAEEMFAVFPLVQQLHEMLWYLQQSLTLKETHSLHNTLQKIYEETVDLAVKSPEEILKTDIVAHRSKVNALLIDSSKLYRGDNNKKGKLMKQKSDYIGANLKGLNLQGANFRGKLMIASNLSQSDLRRADFIGSDLRDADLSGANLTEVLFLTQSQINSAIGDVHTKIPSYLEKPSHWIKKSNS
ncbi:putative low-complexity protein [Schinkia azotoformans MEV2011]|uniref:Putative low-complexity protein n=1 Tax=Schinkia azotoformans MEV2011 TaxID=1348973 RepID=A0A072NED9_SCHAZ|nr:pentapeptide repeat-containing protein [Schinkia azotoformans]KEF35921.1 putative low-complexity protein [Schinkia azotoformans MEV2011]MEC1697520.1 pentapeptide repeat-containing protein [Schinkia azotoformans]MEC1714408.1 pentapeptide repeat-containing protein [Schinkia azotoformans]MEC1723727.1 pentapeptide repeat-containing protein [Schinkia azotoformans]MEC1743344.1 pentapeptide repeat-containing protein [Schinkia azotoformans]